ncbi:MULTISPECIES: flagellar FliJ family protein [unclassified Lebetimonas]|uniref:flagellar FliJ family protein n=1 Tax=unclassified Lebetimonas TaxID=2648158 RepID=UPI000465A95E|nr:MULTISPECIES: flagellar FliJ family protein [unclassified Lebetimonas]
MKTKFSSVVKIKKQVVQKLEKDVQKINFSITKLNKKIENLQNILFSLTLPENGNFSLFSQIKSQQHLLRGEMEKLKNQIIVLENRKNELMNELKKANIEYEKMKYLENEEIKKILKKAKLKEAKEMDEIAILLRKKNESK